MSKSKEPKEFYSNEIQEQIIEKYPYVQNDILAKDLGINISTMKEFARRKGIKKKVIYHSNKNGLSLESKKFIIDNYSKMKSNDICKKLNIEYKVLSSYAVSKGLKKNREYSNNYVGKYLEILEERKYNKEYNINNYINQSKETKINKELLYKSTMGKYSVNDKYFENIDNEWKAYWLGFLYADGNVSKKKDCIKLSLQRNDKYHIQEFLDSLQSDSQIKDDKTILNGKEFYKSSGYVCNKKMCEDLIKLGCVPNKSMVLSFPNNDRVPNELMRHFIRGYFDGDGWVSHYKDRECFEVGYIGSKYFIKSLNDYLKKELDLFGDISLKKNHGSEETLSCCFGNLTDCEKIYNYMYYNSNIHLKRKIKKFDELFLLKAPLQ